MNCEWIGWCALDANAQAAWVQAVGSVLAIVVAVAVPFWLAKSDRAERIRRDQLRVRSYALLLMQRVDRLAATIRSVQQELSENDPEVDQYRVHISELEKATGDWILQTHELGPAAAPLQGAMADVAELASILEEWDFYYRYGPVYSDPGTGEEERFPDPPDYSPTIKRAGEHIAEAANKIREVVKAH